MPSEPSPGGHTAYVLKVYPRYSETFVTTEILAREAAGEEIVIYSLRPPTDPRFHPELGRVAAHVHYLEKPIKSTTAWEELRAAAESANLFSAIGRHLTELLAASAEDALQAVQLAAAVKCEGVTHMHAHFASTATTVARLASLVSEVPYSFTAHAKDLFLGSVDRVDLARKLADARFVVTISDFNERFLRTTCPGVRNIHRLYNGLELERFAFVDRPPRGAVLRVAAVGRLVEKKGFSVLIDAAAVLAASGLQIAVDIAGGGELDDTLTEQIRQAGLTEQVRLLGPIPQDEIADLLRRADVFVAPCVIAADGNADGLPTVLLEAMATGVPCISTDVTGIPEVVRPGDTGILCRAGRVDDLAQALRMVANRSFDLDGMVVRARRLIEEHFDSTIQARALRDLTAQRSLEEVA